MAQQEVERYTNVRPAKPTATLRLHQITGLGKDVKQL